MGLFMVMGACRVCVCDSYAQGLNWLGAFVTVMKLWCWSLHEWHGVTGVAE